MRISQKRNSVAKVFLVLVIIYTALSGETVTQTDWSEGPGVAGPIEGFGAVFASSDSIDYLYQKGRLSLAAVISENPEPDAHNIGDMLSTLDKKIEPGDMDGDGDIDVAISATSSVVWFENDGRGNFLEMHTIISSGSEFFGYDVEDFNFDGADDVVVGETVTGSVLLLYNDGEGNFHLEDTVGDHTEVHQVSARDYDGDGDIDVVSTRHHKAGPAVLEPTALFHENDGTNHNYTSHMFGGFGLDAARRINSGDLDGDEDLDFLSSANHGSLWMENKVDLYQDPWFEKHVLNQTDVVMYDWIGDVDKDGDLDVVVCDLYGYYLHGPFIYINDGEGHFSEQVLPAGSIHPEAAVTIDMDYDGDVDVVQSFFGGGDAGSIIIYENDGNNTFEPGLFTYYPYSCDLQVADISGNGYTDLVGSTHGPGRSIDWWERLVRFRVQGELTSSVFNATEPALWTSIDWDEKNYEGMGQNVQFIVRTTDDTLSWPDWETCDTIEDPGSLNSYVTQRTRYMQYKVILSTTDTDYTPFLYEVRIAYDPLEKGISVAPDQEDSLAGGESKNYPLVVTNLCNVDDIANLTIGSSSLPDWEAILLDDIGTPLADSNSDGAFEIGPLESEGGYRDIILKVTAPGSAEGGTVDTTIVGGVLTFDRQITDSAVIVTVVRTMPEVDVKADTCDSTYAALPIRYTATVSNLGNRADNINLLVKPGHPWQWNIYDSTGLVPLTDTDGDLFTDVGTLASRDGTTDVWLEVLPPAGIPPRTTDTSYLVVFSAFDNSTRDSILLETLILDPPQELGVQAEPDTSGFIEAGMSIDYDLRVVNTGEVSDSFMLVTSSDLDWEAELSDTKCILDVFDTFSVRLQVQTPSELASIVGTPVEKNIEHRIFSAISLTDSLVADTAIMITQTVPPLDIHNFPNPFSGSTTFIYSIPCLGKATLAVYNRTAEHIITLFSDMDHQPGIFTFPWEGCNSEEKKVAPGVYLYVLTFDPEDGETRKIVKKALVQP